MARRFKALIAFNDTGLFYWPGNITTIRLSLRRTLVLFSVMHLILSFYNFRFAYGRFY